MNTTSYDLFDDKTAHAMGVAFDSARKSVSYFGVVVIAHSFMALRIIEAAQAGERDPARLYEEALKELGIDPASSPITA